MAAARWLLTLGLLGAVTLTAMLLRARSAPPPAESARSADLKPWELVGCYALDIAPWEAERMIPLRGSAEPRDAPLTAFGFPDAIMLQRDSLDEWGRPLGSYRVVALTSPDSTPPGGAPADRAPTGGAATASEEEVATTEHDKPTLRIGALRWYTRSDTLWILGSIPGARIGVALFDMRDSLVGQARLVAREGRRGAMAPASAWPINCATRARELPPARPRR
jgi:hypothetical protein